MLNLMSVMQHLSSKVKMDKVDPNYIHTPQSRFGHINDKVAHGQKDLQSADARRVIGVTIRLKKKVWKELGKVSILERIFHS